MVGLLKPSQISLGADINLYIKNFDSLNIGETQYSSLGIVSRTNGVAALFRVRNCNLLDGVHCLIAAMVDFALNVSMSLWINCKYSVILAVLDLEVQFHVGAVLHVYLANVVW